MIIHYLWFSFYCLDHILLLLLQDRINAAYRQHSSARKEARDAPWDVAGSSRQEGLPGTKGACSRLTMLKFPQSAWLLGS